MDSSKRKVNGASAVAGDDVDDRASKRRKIPGDSSEPSKGETPQTTKENGFKLLEIIRKTEDKSGRLIAADFLTLPSRRELPQYYKEIKLPIALDTIETKLKRLEVPNLSSLESLFKRMIANAREFNEKGSRIYDDAERLRKALSNFMTKHNPAYKSYGYVAVPTPIPGEGDAEDEDAVGEVESEAEMEVETETETPAKRRGRPPRNSAVARNSATPTLSDVPATSFSGLTLQQAQEKIVRDLMDYKEDPEDDFAGFEPFVELPDRSLKDYYAVIPNPVSLVKLQKRVKGIQGRGAATGISDFKNWAAFEEEASFIWKNAYHYNEDGSDIFLLAKELEAFFYKKLKEAKQAVPDPAGTKIKLKLPDAASRITLKLGGTRGSPAGSPAPQANGSNSNGVPVNGAGRRNPFGGSYSSATPIPSLDQLERARSMSGSVDSPTTSNAVPVKNEETRNSPAIPPGQNNRSMSVALSTPGLNGNGMPPPSTPGLSNNYTQSGFAQSFSHQPQYTPNPAFESKWRQPGKNASDAMITNLSLATHPGLNLSKHFRMDLPPSPTMAQQSITINLPSTHYYLQIKPTIAASLLERQYKLFVTSGTQRLHAMPTIPGHSVDPRHPLFEARLLPGVVNRVEIELIAALPKGAAKPANGQEVEVEKITIFANLLR